MLLDVPDKGAAGRSRRLPTTRRLLFAAALAALTLLAAGCGGGAKAPGVANLGTTTGSEAGSTPTSAAPWAQCMNTHGIPASADPGGYISIPPSAKNSPQLQPALKACQSLLPVIDQGGGGPRSTPQAGKQMLKFATCMRKHGLSDFPDPKFINGLWTLPGMTGAGSGDLDPNSPQFQAAATACQSVAPGHIGHR